MFIMLRFTCGERKIFGQTSKSLKYYDHDCLEFFFFFFAFMLLLKTVMVKNSHILTGSYFIFQKKHTRPKLIGFNTIFGPR